ncbi:XRE family transcriptional regulator [Streptomyces flavofungini]|uniref:XRE family transcriptional regulator n=1 Tax=Streptomyces flavofungini TaxID=68200 RepID=UPI0025B1BD8C|nr:XRE family transcriptional regulator [Streptomyces flavofungini]WJV51816.1 XRE family transcriptional regulator [Streptomyces flavofungini]WJV51835.1 XRE family transcriptional regulator [Streptomyces flavofungini]
MDDRPTWARRMREERLARQWSQITAVRSLMARLPYDPGGPDEQSMLRQWKRWEAGEKFPEKYKIEIAATFGTTTNAFFPPTGREPRSQLQVVGGVDTVEIVARMRASDVDQATLDALRITVDRLCSEYAYLPTAQLLTEGRAWMSRVVAMLDRRVSLSQMRDLYALAGKLALLVGCVEYDSGDPRQAEATRRAALSLGDEAGHLGVIGWGHEMRCWFSLTRGDYRGVIQAAREGVALAPNESVAAQLFAQEAKAWARLGDRQQTEIALDKGRQVLEALPYPDNIEDHFVVDPAKYDFYRMDCYRKVGEDQLAEQLAGEVIRASTDFDGTERAPMRIAEARITLAVAAARSGDLDSALSYGERALGGERQSLPSLTMVASDLGQILKTNYAKVPDAVDFRAHLRNLNTPDH